MRMTLFDINNKRVLISPLSWGLGHAARIIPLVKQLESQGCKVVVCSSGDTRILLENELKTTEFLDIPELNIKYYKNISAWLSISFQLHKIIRSTRRDSAFVSEIIANRDFDIIISDNRYGFICKGVKSILISHQLNVIFPKLLKPLGLIVNYFLKKKVLKFDYLWVPDYDNGLLTDKLSQFSSPNIQKEYIGPLSRLSFNDIQEDVDILLMLSGPEPMRTILERTVLIELQNCTRKITVLRGKPSCSYVQALGSNVTVYNHADNEKIATLICNAKTIISRGGYSTIMDLLALNKTAILIPTPGQTEQEYICNRAQEIKQFQVLKQNQITNGGLKSLLKI